MNTAMVPVSVQVLALDLPPLLDPVLLSDLASAANMNTAMDLVSVRALALDLVLDLVLATNTAMVLVSVQALDLASAANTNTAMDLVSVRALASPLALPSDLVPLLDLALVTSTAVALVSDQALVLTHLVSKVLAADLVSDQLSTLAEMTASPAVVKQAHLASAQLSTPAETAAALVNASLEITLQLTLTPLNLTLATRQATRAPPRERTGMQSQLLVASSSARSTGARAILFPTTPSPATRTSRLPQANLTVSTSLPLTLIIPRSRHDLTIMNRVYHRQHPKERGHFIRPTRLG